MENRVVIYITPYSFYYKGCKVTIWGAKRFDLPTGERRYLLSLEVEWRGYRSRQFTLEVKDSYDFKNKLDLEIARMKLAILTGNLSPFVKVR